MSPTIYFQEMFSCVFEKVLFLKKICCYFNMVYWCFRSMLLAFFFKKKKNLFVENKKYLFCASQMLGCDDFLTL